MHSASFVKFFLPRMKEIETLGTKLSTNEMQKCSLMQRLLTGEVRITVYG